MRMQQLAQEEAQTTAQSLQTLPLDEMEKLIINFGEKHRGQTFGQAFADSKWAEWVVSTYSKSQKPEHVRFMQYVEKKLDSEAEVTSRTKTPKSGNSKTPQETRIKSNVKEAATVLPEWDTISEPEMPSSHVLDLQDQLSNMQQDQLNIHHRMSGLESAMQEVISHLKGLQVKTET